MTPPMTEPPGDETTSGRPPRRTAGRLGLAVGLTLLGLAGAGLLVAGLWGVGAPRASAPVIAPDSRPAVTVTGPVAPSPAGAAQLPPSPPTRIAIPAIGVDSPVESVGLNPDGTVEVPAPGPHYDQPAWYRGSVTPGRSGPAVILGHIDSAANGPSVFYRLSQLRPLDEFTVARADGRTITYRIDSVRQYPKDAFPSDEVYGATTRPEVRLITCGGPFDSRARSYLDNTVVYADQIEPPAPS
jgi:sortase (surface protein transpeptidase)